MLPTRAVPEVAPEIATDSERTETVFGVLAAQARGRTTSELRTTAIGCGVNAALIWWQYPRLSWLAAAFVAASAYGLWGLVDRAVGDAQRASHPDRGRTEQLIGFRGIAIVAGTGAALWSAFNFMAVALGGWIL